ncbi:MAG: Trm112 family protein [Candidatus Aenigmatarchaeota archaeon]
MPLSKELLDIIACPKCKGDVKYDSKRNVLFCNKCRLRYKILDGDIPDMLIEDAERF